MSAAQRGAKNMRGRGQMRFEKLRRKLALVWVVAIGVAGCGGGGGAPVSGSSAFKPEAIEIGTSNPSGDVEGVKVAILRSGARDDRPMTTAEAASSSRIAGASGYFIRTEPVAGVPGGRVQLIAGPDPAPRDIETSTNYATVNLSVATFFPKTLQADLYEGTSLQDLNIGATASGDFSLLNGRALHVVIADPDGLFQDNPQAWFTTGSTPGMVIWLRGRPLFKPPGSYRGALRVYACLDSACTVRLGNTPIRIPYEVRVRKGLSIETSKVTLSTVFGVPAAAKIRVTPSEGRSINEIVIYESRENVIASFSAVEADGSAILNVDGLVSKPGTYTRRITLATSGLYSHPVDVAKEIDITYTVAPDPNRSYAFDPPRLDVMFKAGDGRSYSRMSYAYVMQGELSFEAIEFLATPAQLAAVPANLQGRWVSVRTWGQYNEHLQPDGRLTNEVIWWICDPVTHQCMPPDTYPYRLRLKYILNGTSSTVYQYGQVQISP
jgi:hypothetical protein